ncbi:amidase domain-containing protein [Actinoallomurus vinaceus]
MAGTSNYLHTDGKAVSFNRDSHPGRDVVHKFTAKPGQAVRAGSNGYSGIDAANYADAFATTYNPSFAHFDGDCNNFVSQALWAGGLKQTAHVSDDYHWWYSSADSWALSWVNIDHQAAYLQNTIPGATWRYTWGPEKRTNTYTPDDIVTGDVIYYSWDGANGGGREHASMQVGIGTDSTSGWYGNVVDAHTSGRYHAFWSLAPYNSGAADTTFQLWHVWP